MKKLLAALFFLSFAMSAIALEPDERPLKVSLVQLLAVPERYDGKEVWVAGFVELGFESTTLYLHREDYQARLLQNSLWLSQDSEQVARQREQLHLQYVELVATFSSGRKGHMGMFPGSLHRIKWMARVPGT